MKTEMLTRKSDVDSAEESTWNMSYHISYDIHLIFIWYSFHIKTNIIVFIIFCHYLPNKIYHYWDTILRSFYNSRISG